MNGNKEPQMTTPNFQHVRLSMVGDVALVEIRTRDLQGPKAGKELGSELAQVLAQEWARRILLDFHRTAFLSSSGFAALFKLVNQAPRRAERSSSARWCRGSWSGRRWSACRRSSRSTRTRPGL